jgi:hypothetical protein
MLLVHPEVCICRREKILHQVSMGVHVKNFQGVLRMTSDRVVKCDTKSWCKLFSRNPRLSRKTSMTEERKHAILFAATLLSARKIIEVIDNDDPQNMGRKFWIDRFTDKAIDLGHCGEEEKNGK